MGSKTINNHMFKTGNVLEKCERIETHINVHKLLRTPSANGPLYSFSWVSSRAPEFYKIIKTKTKNQADAGESSKKKEYNIQNKAKV